MGAARDAVLGVVLVGLGAVLRQMWRLSERVSRIEGRLNGKERPPR